MIKLKKYLKDKYPKTYFFLKFFYYYNYFIKIIFYSIKYKIKKYKINQPLILITQIQRSGGTLLNSLFDGSDQVFSYPHELMIFNPKWKIKKLSKNFFDLYHDNIHNLSLKFNYQNFTNVEWNEKYKFIFSVFRHYDLFKKEIKNIKLREQRKLFNAYFYSFFNSFLNYNSFSNKKKYIVAFVPRVNMENSSIQKIKKFYPDGFIITIIRNPKSWISSAYNHSSEYKNIGTSLDLWHKSFLNSINLKKKYPDKVILIKFEDLIFDTKKIMKYICKKVSLKYEPIFIKPTFNKKKILSNSSFKNKKGINKDSIKRKINIKIEADYLKKLNYYSTKYERFKISYK